MKTIKKLMTLVLSIAMILAMGVTAFADDASATSAPTITITNAQEKHTYEAYQIFKGDLSDGVLSNIAWGDGVTEAGQVHFGNAADKAKKLGSTADAAQFAKEIGGNASNPSYLDINKGKTGTYQNGEYVISGLEAGYYFVRDITDVDDKDDFKTAYIMKVVGMVDVTLKGDKPTLDKQIKHNENGQWGVVGDNQIGDTVEFRTITTVPDVEGYSEYVYNIHDTMSVGLTSNVQSEANITIRVNDATELGKEYYTVSVDSSNTNKFTVTVNILKAIADNKVEKHNSLYMYYTGVLNEDAKIYDDTNQNNVAYLEYSNNPNGDEKGKTPEKKVYDWTFKIGVNKVNGGGDALSGAKFVLSKKGNLQDSDIADEAKLIALIKKDNGVYTVAPNGYNDSDKTYEIEAGKVVINGLDDATDYYLYETKAPDKYNKLTDPIKFTISATYKDAGSNYDQVTVTVDKADSTGMEIQVVNNQGSTLPSTGGMGTTIFYVVGTILVLAAVVLLITKKRMHADK